MDTSEAGATAAPVGDSRPSKEEVLAYLTESGMLDVLREELAMTPNNQFAEVNSEGVVEFSQGMGTGGFPWIYWKKADGRVITGPERRETMYPIYIRKGFTPMEKYGLLPTPGSPVPCCKGKFMRTDQFHVLLARGGAKEMSLEQIVYAGWHENPPVIHGQTIEFPQLKGKHIDKVECDECDKPIYGVKGRLIATLRQHCKAVHGLARRDVEEMLNRVGYKQRS